MNLAITLLVVVAIASVIGTVLQQNQPYEDYILKFGPFWFEVYKTLGLYDVYSAAWFLVILSFLVVSTSICVYRNAPAMLRDMRSFRENATEKSLRAFHERAEWRVAAPGAEVIQALQRHLGSYGYRVRPKRHGEYTLLAGMKGAVNRIGYIFTHVAIVVICVGGLLDGNMPLKVQEMTGKIKIETRTLSTSQIPAISRLPIDNRSFRGVASIPEGSTAKHVEVRLRDGYLLQELPFEIKVQDFRIEHYPSGQPKSFESDLIVYDKDLPAPLRHTISVNHPLLYKGYAVYQANFGDGGSTLHLRAWPLNAADAPLQTQGVVGHSLKLAGAQGPLTVELNDFKLFNVRGAPPESGKKFQDLGPSFIFKVRDAAGQALEYENYMAPIDQQGRLFFVSGVRDNPNVEFNYVHIPVDPNGGIERFMNFMGALRDAKQRAAVAAQVARQSLAQGGKPAVADIEKALTGVIQRLLTHYSDGGFEQVTRYLQANLTRAQAQQAENFVNLLQEALATLYDNVLVQEGAHLMDASAQQANKQFFDDALNALGVLPQYGSPYYLQLVNFDHLQASGLQITRAPGKNVVYLGFGLLIIGVFIMFYLPQRRLWALIKPAADGATEVLLAGSSQRDRIGFAKEFSVVREGLAAGFNKT